MKMGLVGVVRQLNLALGRPWAGAAWPDGRRRATPRPTSGAPQFFVLADSTYNPDAVDELAAAHADAQCVVSKVPGGGGGGGWGLGRAAAAAARSDPADSALTPLTP